MDNRGDNQPTNSRIGLIVFALGIIMLGVVFWWGYQFLGSIDTQIAQVRTTPAVTTPAAESTEGDLQLTSPETVVAQPRPGLSLGQVAVMIGLKLVGLIVLAYVSALVAAKGAQLAGSSPRKT